MRDVAALISGQTLLQVAGGLLGVWLPLQMSALRFSAGEIGFVAAAYGLGFLAGAWVAQPVLARVGAIRAYSAAAALACVATLTLHAGDHAWFWAASRLAAGLAIAVMFAAAEGWLAAAMPDARRGDVTGFYMLCTKLGLASGPFVIGLAHPAPGAAGPIMAAAAFMALSLVPVAMADSAPPPPPPKRRIHPGALFAKAPAAVVAAFGAGLVNGAVLTLAPLYAAGRGGAEAAAGFQAAAWIGSLLVQWHAGKWSDRTDRRFVLAILIGVPGLAALALAALGDRLGLLAATCLFAVWGAGSLSYYGVAVAHLGDRSERADLAAASAGLLFVWAAGAIVGPALGGLAVELGGGPRAVFWQAAIGAAIMTPWVLWRTRRRPAPPAADKVSFGPVQTNSAPGQSLPLGGKAADGGGTGPEGQ